MHIVSVGSWHPQAHLQLRLRAPDLDDFVILCHPQVFSMHCFICKQFVSLQERTKELDLNAAKQCRLFNAFLFLESIA